MTEAELPHNYLSPVPRHGLPDQLFTYASPLRSHTPIEITVHIPPIRVNNCFASYQWNSGLYLADRIVCEELLVRGRRVLELGAGTGLSGLMAARKGAELVVLSDYDDAGMMGDLEENVERSGPGKEARETIKVVGHTWGEDCTPLSQIGPFDLILCADLIWDAPLHSSLLRTLTTLLSHSPHAEIVLAAGFHTGRHVVRVFLECAQEVGLRIVEGEEWEEVSGEGERRKWSWREGGEEERQEERKSWILEGRLGWEE